MLADCSRDGVPVGRAFDALVRGVAAAAGTGGRGVGKQVAAVYEDGGRAGEVGGRLIGCHANESYPLGVEAKDVHRIPEPVESSVPVGALVEMHDRNVQRMSSLGVCSRVEGVNRSEERARDLVISTKDRVRDGEELTTGIATSRGQQHGRPIEEERRNGEEHER